MPDCTLETYQKFRKEINELCNDTAFSFGVSDIVLKSSKIPDKFIAFKDTGKKYFQITYVTEHFLDYYHIKTKKWKFFHKKIMKIFQVILYRFWLEQIMENT